MKLNSLNEQISTVAQMELQKIYVLPAFQSLGAGSSLLAAVKELAREQNTDQLWLDTHVSNVNAVRFYERNGFKKIGKHYFSIGMQLFEYYVLSWDLTLATNDQLNTRAKEII